MVSETVNREKPRQIASQAQESHKRRKITGFDLEVMAEHYRDGLNDSEACEIAGIKPMTWFKWKGKPKNQAKFANILSRMKGNRIKACFDGIERAGVKDWRALRELLSLTDPRFNDRLQSAPTMQINHFTAIGIDVERLLAEGAERAKNKLLPTVEVQALPEPRKP